MPRVAGSATAQRGASVEPVGADELRLAGLRRCLDSLAQPGPKALERVELAERIVRPLGDRDVDERHAVVEPKGGVAKAGRVRLPELRVDVAH